MVRSPWFACPTRAWPVLSSAAPLTLYQKPVLWCLYTTTSRDLYYICTIIHLKCIYEESYYSRGKASCPVQYKRRILRSGEVSVPGGPRPYD